MYVSSACIAPRRAVAVFDREAEQLDVADMFLNNNLVLHSNAAFLVTMVIVESCARLCMRCVSRCVCGRENKLGN